MPLMPFMPVQIFIQAAKMEEKIFFICPKLPKMIPKILLSFTKDAKETKVRVYKKWCETMGLLDFKVS